MLASLLSLALAATVGAASVSPTIFVADYSGNITSLALTEKTDNGGYTLNRTHLNDGCAPNPSWLTIDSARGQLFCLNEGLTSPNGSLASFRIGADGSLTRIRNATTVNGPVHGVLYGSGSSTNSSSTGPGAIALAHYGGSAVSSWIVAEDGNVTLNQNIFYTLPQPGPDAGRQNAPHLHQVVLDPTGQYILAPDLGADLVRVYSYDAQTLKLQEREALKAAPGSGPRHLTFYNPDGRAGGPTYMYLVSELTATVTGYTVTYKPNYGGVEFVEIGYQKTTWLHNLPQTNAPAGIAISPDNRFLIISNRNDTAFTLPNAIGKSDSVSTWELHRSGNLTFHQLWPAGGSNPRSFDMSPRGDFLALGYQISEAVAVLARDTQSGLIREPVGRIPIEGNVTAVVWHEPAAAAAAAAECSAAAGGYGS